MDRLGTIFITDPETGDPVRTGDIIPEVAVDPASGALYVVWQDARFSNGEFDSIAFSQSLDGGLTWSDPIKVNLTPTDVPPGNQQAFTPSVHVAADGTVGVTYYDFRNKHRRRITADRLLPLANGFFTGDYEGLSSIGDSFTPFFSSRTEPIHQAPSSERWAEARPYNIPIPAARGALWVPATKSCVELFERLGIGEPAPS